MRASLLCPLGLVLLLLLGIPGPASFLPAAQGQTAAHRHAPEPVYTPTTVEQVPRLVGGGDIITALEAAVQHRLTLPKDIGVTEQSRVFVQFVVGKTGKIENLVMVHGILDYIDAPLLAAIRALPAFVPGRHHGQPVRVAYHDVPLRLLGPASPTRLVPPAPRPAIPDSTARRLEARTLRAGIARRQPLEAADEFLARVLPLSYPASGDLLVYGWIPGPFGQQLFFSVPGREGNEYGSDLFVLDPIKADTYNVQVLSLGSLGDVTTLAALFFTDVNQDGQKELLTLSECSLREEFTADDGTRLTGRAAHYATTIFQYRFTDASIVPRYEQDPTPRPYLDELATATEVREALRQHRGKIKAGK
ncbi:energy transducer TonB [Hymenobacter persicinus]|uniref:TonB C-terminal domain-containing protein n=1 Tax=Hymenobacter persicinus TaxID=2025506 RepID=A0A4Q5LFB0_9BACT|nr:hypothetical protein [Hymenobacter persicinus]RYU83255.1 hypothetical protein EWM57_02920 [Hymenobacter persicinus]